MSFNFFIFICYWRMWKQEKLPLILSNDQTADCCILYLVIFCVPINIRIMHLVDMS